MDEHTVYINKSLEPDEKTQEDALIRQLAALTGRIVEEGPPPRGYEILTAEALIDELQSEISKKEPDPVCPHCGGVIDQDPIGGSGCDACHAYPRES